MYRIREFLEISAIFVVLLVYNATAAATSTATQSSASAQTDRIDCKNVQCTPIRCPDDSELFVEQQPGETKNFNYKDDYDANNIDDNEDDGTIVDDTEDDGDVGVDQHNRRHADIFNKFYVETSDDQDKDQQENRTLIKRSLQYKRREPIKIVPGDYISLVPEVGNYYNFASANHHKWKRDSALPVPIENDQNFDECCPAPKCVCKDNCTVPQCSNPSSVLIKITPGNMDKPGDCCPTYQCIKEPNCTDIETNKKATWFEACKTCECLAGQKMCHNTCKPEEMELPRNCLSASAKIYFEGATWQEDECTHCQCFNSEIKCQKSFCRALHCSRKIKIAGECCPICAATTLVAPTSSSPSLPTTGVKVAEVEISSTPLTAITSSMPSPSLPSSSSETDTDQSSPPSSTSNQNLPETYTVLPITEFYDSNAKFDVERILLYCGIVVLISISAIFAYLWYHEKNKKQDYYPVNTDSKNKKQDYGRVSNSDSNSNRVGRDTNLTTA